MIKYNVIRLDKKEKLEIKLLLLLIIDYEVLLI
jgi:hypothetical protein